MKKILKAAIPTTILFFIPWMHHALYLDLTAAWPDVYDPHSVVVAMQLLGALATVFVWTEV